MKNPFALLQHSEAGFSDLKGADGAWLLRFEKLVKQSDDLEMMDWQGRTAMALLALNNDGYVVFDKAVDALMKAGANPLKHGAKAWFLHIEETCALDESILHQMAIGMCEREETAPLRCPLGGNLVHVMAENPLLFSKTALASTAPLQNFPLLTRWFTEARSSDGATPLHVLWYENRGGPAYREPSVWEATRTLIDRLQIDLNFMQRDNNGVCVAELMEQALVAADRTSTPIPFRPECWHKIRSQLEQERMEQATPSALGHQGRGLRL